MKPEDTEAKRVEDTEAQRVVDTKAWIPLRESARDHDHDIWHDKINTLIQEVVVSMARLQREVQQLQRWQEEIDRERSRFPEMEWDEGA